MTTTDASVDRETPEYVVVLDLVAYAMEKFKVGHRRYARTWYELGQNGFHTAGVGYHVGDPGTVPTEADTHTWRPLRDRYRYRIASSAAETFHLQALNADDEPFFEIRQGQSRPVNTKTQKPWIWGDRTDF